MASASAPSPLRPITSPSEEPISPTRPRAPTVRIGVRPTAPTYGSALSYIPEIPWNDSCAGSILAAFFGYSVGYGSGGFCGSSHGATIRSTLTVARGSGGPSGCATGVPAANLVVGGTCKGYAKPSWQTGVPGIPNDGVRDLPDVSLFAANGLWGHYYVFCFSDPSNGGAPCAGTPDCWSGAGGTSFASPIMAGIQALVNQKMGGAQGNPNPVYYKLAASSVASSVFHSITTGDIAVNCSGDINCFGAGFVGRGRATPVTGFDGNGGLSTSQPNLYAGLCRRQRLELRYRARQRGCLQPDHELEQRPIRMTPMYKTIFLLSGALLMAVAPARRRGSEFRYQRDGQPQRTIPVPLRQFLQRPTGNLTESCSLTGTITFDGAGTLHALEYATVRFGRCRTAPAPAPRWAGEPTECNPTASPNWTILFTRPLFSAPSANPCVIASSTEDDYFDLFIAVQAPATSSSNSILSGTFTVGTLDFLNSSASLARQGYFTLKADGHGNIAAFTVTGSLAECELRRHRYAECCGLHLCALRHGGWNLDFSRQLGQSDRDRQRRQGFVCVGRWQLVRGRLGNRIGHVLRVSRTLRNEFEFDS